MPERHPNQICILGHWLQTKTGIKIENRKVSLLEPIFLKIDSENRKPVFLTLYFGDNSIALGAKSSKLRPFIFLKKSAP